jgi:MerR family copper efflux transcriptional regulator
MNTIGKIAGSAGVSVDTVRFYERTGLLPRAQRTASGYRLYAEATVDRLRFIRQAKMLGFSLEDIAELLHLHDGGGSRRAVRGIAQRRLAEVERRIADLERMRATLAHLVGECSGSGTVHGCPIIESLVREPDGRG